MADAQRGSIVRSLLNDRTDIAVAAGVIAVIMMMIIPLPTWLLDVLMAFNLALSLLIILIVLYTKRPSISPSSDYPSRDDDLRSRAQREFDEADPRSRNEVRREDREGLREFRGGHERD
jgi:hypothetical protein